jgi:hypothetical protein
MARKNDEALAVGLGLLGVILLIAWWFSASTNFLGFVALACAGGAGLAAVRSRGTGAAGSRLALAAVGAALLVGGYCILLLGYE